MKVYSIYRIANKVNGKVYIGYTERWPQRFLYHKSKSKQVSNNKLYLDVKEIGWESFEVDVIYQSKDKKHCLGEMESYFIKEYNSVNKGYNFQTGGHGKIKKEFNLDSKDYLSLLNLFYKEV